MASTPTTNDEVFDVGDVAVVEFTFETWNPSTSTRSLSDPGTVTVTLKSPSGATSSPTAQRISTGKYYFTAALDEPGRWTYWIEASAPAQSAEGGVLVVRRRQ